VVVVVAEQVIVEVTALNVKLVDVVKFNGGELDNVTLDAPRLIVLTFEFVDDMLVALTANPPVLKVPLVTVISAVVVNAADNVRVKVPAEGLAIVILKTEAVAVLVTV